MPDIMGGSQPFMYNAEWRNDARFPATTFDPKAVTRASWEPKPRKLPQTGPLISFNRHPDAHMLPSQPKNQFLSLGQRTKKWVKWLRNVQLLIRILEINGAIGTFVLLILITNIDEIAGWILRITPGVAMAHCLYAIYHLSRKASGRTPGSSAAYHVFAAVSDLVVLSLYAFGAFFTHGNAQSWTTRLSNQSIMKYFVPAVYYTTVGAGGLHLISLSISLWLGLAFRRISLMPPDMNPLEDHLTARPFHKRNKSSITTNSSFQDEKRLSTTSNFRDRTGSELHEHSRSTFVPFLHTRTGSSNSIESRGSSANHPSRQYQIVPGNSSPGLVSHARVNPLFMPRSSHLGLYSSVPVSDASTPGGLASKDRSEVQLGRSTKNWQPTDRSCARISQTNNNKRAATPNFSRQAPGGKPYTALVQAFNEDDSAESDYDDENNTAYDRPKSLVLPAKHPNPLASHPTSPTRISHNQAVDRESNGHRAKYSHGDCTSTSLSEMSGNLRRVSNSRDVTDLDLEVYTPWKRQRESLSPLEGALHAKSYGQLGSATPSFHIVNDRKRSSGVDYGSSYGSGLSGRRNMSGRMTDEERALR